MDPKSYHYIKKIVLLFLIIRDDEVVPLELKTRRKIDGKIFELIKVAEEHRFVWFRNNLLMLETTLNIFEMFELLLKYANMRNANFNLIELS